MKSLIYGLFLIGVMVTPFESKAQSPNPADYPASIICTGLQAPLSIYVFQQFGINLDQQKVGYRWLSALPGEPLFQLNYNLDGTFHQVVGPDPNTDCNASPQPSLSTLEANGKAFVFASSGDTTPSNLIAKFAAADCPEGWTRQVQTNQAGTSDQDVITCLRD